jgi:hypothetical protein
VTTDECTSVETPPLFRAVNLRIAELWSSDVGVIELMCECPDATCTRVMRMTDAEFDTITSQPGVYAVLYGHERLMQDGEVVGRTDRYVLVQKNRIGGGGCVTGGGNLRPRPAPQPADGRTRVRFFLPR